MSPNPQSAIRNPQLARARAKALNGAGILAYSQGDYGAARALLEESLGLWRELGDRQGIGSALNNLGSVAEQGGDYGAARALYEEALAVRRALDDGRSSSHARGNIVHRRGIAFSLSSLGNLALAEGDRAAAKSLLEESLGILREIGDRQSICNALAMLGGAAAGQDDEQTARARYEESLSIARELGNRQSMALSLNQLGLLEQRQGNFAAARELHARSLILRRELGDRRGVAECLEGLAGASLCSGPDRAPDAPGPAEKAVRLLGAAQAQREAIAAPRSPSDEAEHERRIVAARTALGEKAFEAAWAEGRALRLEQAVAHALEDVPLPGSSLL